MSEFIHKSEIAALKQSNAELNNVISNLEAELHELKCELERLRRENPDDKKKLKERITEFEHREAELKERMLLISREAKRNNKKHVVVKQLLSALQVEDAAIVESGIEQYYKKKGFRKLSLPSFVEPCSPWLSGLFLLIQRTKNFTTQSSRTLPKYSIK